LSTGDRMERFIEGEDRRQVTLLPECLDDFVAEDNPVRIIEVFVEELDLESLGFDGAKPSITGRPSYHPSVLLKIYTDSELRDARGYGPETVLWQHAVRHCGYVQSRHATGRVLASAA
jgi:hypothetical protein